MTDQASPVEQTGGNDVRADVLSAFEKHGVPTEPEWALKDDPTPDAPEDTERAERARDEHGRFTKAAAKEPAAEKTAEAPAVKVSGTDKPEETTVQTSTSGSPPPGWPADAKSEWSKLSPAIQAAVLKRESEISEGGRRWSEEKRRYEEMIMPLRELAQQYGVQEGDVIRKFLAADAYLQRDPAGAIQWLAQSYGVDLQQLVTGAPSQQTPRVDPLVQSLYRELTQLKQNLTAREQEEIDSEIRAFESPDRPHFSNPEVRYYMGLLLENGKAQSMEDAYKKAVWLVDEVRENLIAEREASIRGEREQQARERVDKARRAAVSISGSPVGAPASKQDFGSVREAVVAAWKQHAN